MASTQSKMAMRPEDDPFDSLLTLEDTLYTTAYTAGATDGARAGRIEGRIFGLEKGFEKFAALGELHGRSVVWGARALSPKEPRQEEIAVEKEDAKKDTTHQSEKTLPRLPEYSRLVNNITLLHSLTDPETFSTENTEEAVADFDDRFKRAGAKAKVIERIVGEGETASSAKSPDGSPARGKARNVRLEGGKKGKGDDSMEDFAGSRLLR
ncbi:hypothetical protein FB567DRAFT_1500 [Paraphoma chrysanthemicola]|uniref:Essential protein Yae1 N-terminal domain-containing protein n=1 Tax=Paraphoma chrysanthemicola TaxID=798071 RepID=A0A8K0W3J3_9PLEO|nr:hypothetical protein FB567DRAFT_1500 [Paraphoma chrysanthemicola]